VLRVCGADAARSTEAARRCWCGGLFCGKGGFKASKDFRRDFRIAIPATTRAQYEELVQQEDLFDGPAKREKWRERLGAHQPPAARRRSA